MAKGAHHAHIDSLDQRHSLALSQPEEVPHRNWAVCWHSDDLALIRAPGEALDWSGVAETLAQESELVQSLQAVDEHLIRLGAEGHPPARWADF